MVDKPGRRKKPKRPWGKVAAVVFVVLIIGGASYYVYETYIYKAAPIYAEVYTSLGSFEIVLYPASAPKTVANFVNLAEQGFYNNLTWHRIEKGFVIQIGDPNTRNGGGNRSLWGSDSSNTTVPFEYDPNLHNYAGYIAMASTAAKTGGSSQFYINLADNSANLDGNYAVFGQVIQNMTVVNAIGSVPTESVTVPGGATQDEPVTPIFITSIVILGTSSTLASTS